MEVKVKIEKLSENKLKVTISKEDMFKWNITFDMLLPESNDTNLLFWEIIHKASKQTGIDFDKCRLKVEALKQGKNTYVLIITKMAAETNTPSRYKFKRIKFNYNKNLNARLFVFKGINDFIKFAKSNLFFCFLFDGKNSLFRYKNDVILEVCFNGELELYEKAFCDIISEYATPKIKSDLFLAYVKEHGEIILNQSALKMMYYKM